MTGVKFSLLVCQLFDSTAPGGAEIAGSREESFTPRPEREYPKCSRHPRAAQLAGWRQRLYSEHSYAAASRADGLFSPTPFAFLPDDSSASARRPLVLRDHVA